ncbi:MAG: hypothetical protein H3C51_11920 [Rubellimicrobium sp.]|nr:hypothetical protein [Rubellimicrobium sp.]
MADTFDRAAFWPEPAAFAQDIPGLSVRDLPELPQAYVSGDLAAFLAAGALAPAVGLLGLAQGDRYAVRLARHRLLVVGIEPDAGWNPGGWGVTPVGAGLAVVAVTGPRWRDFFARATPIDPDAASASAAFLLGDGLPAILTRHDAPDNLRLHVGRATLPALHDWLGDCLNAMAR